MNGLAIGVLLILGLFTGLAAVAASASTWSTCSPDRPA